MVKLIFFLVLLIILIFPLYENSKIRLPVVKTKTQNIPIATIENGSFFLYEGNLTTKGEFKKFNIFKDLYSLNSLQVDNILKNEKYLAKKAFLKNKILQLTGFKLYTKDYNLSSFKVVYNLKTKEIEGGRFFLYSPNYKAIGTKFFIDKKRDIKAYDVSFDLKVN